MVAVLPRESFRNCFRRILDCHARGDTLYVGVNMEVNRYAVADKRLEAETLPGSKFRPDPERRNPFDKA